MNSFIMKKSPVNFAATKSAFSLIEVILALGIFLVTVLALVGLIGPTLKSVDEVESVDEVVSVVNTVNAFLQSSPDIAATGETKFEAIYNALADDNTATILVFRAYDSSDQISLKLGFVGETAALVTGTEVVDGGGAVLAAGTVFRVVLTPSGVNPTTTVTDLGAGVYPRYTLIQTTPSLFPEGAFAIEVRIFAEEPGPNFIVTKSPSELAKLDPIFTYNTAIVR